MAKGRSVGSKDLLLKIYICVVFFGLRDSNKRYFTNMNLRMQNSSRRLTSNASTAVRIRRNEP